MAVGGMNPAEKKRLEDAVSKLRKDKNNVAESQLVTVGQLLPVAADDGSSFLRGHGTQKGQEGTVRATVCGVLQKINKLLTVQPLRSCYAAQTGDVIVGRVMDVGPKKWRVDVGAGQEAGLMLSAVNLPGGIQRRKTSVDELNMRTLFVEGDVLTAEVQSTHQDGAVVLHTRSDKYGKLMRGQLSKVPPYLVRRLKHHFVTLPCAVYLVLGCNGWIWAGMTPPPPAADSAEEDGKTEALRMEAASATVPKAPREKICRVVKSISALAYHGFTVDPDSIQRVFQLSVSLGLHVRDMSLPEFLVSVAEAEAVYRQSQPLQN